MGRFCLVTAAVTTIFATGYAPNVCEGDPVGMLQVGTGLINAAAQRADKQCDCLFRPRLFKSEVGGTTPGGDMCVGGCGGSRSFELHKESMAVKTMTFWSNKDGGFRGISLQFFDSGLEHPAGSLDSKYETQSYTFAEGERVIGDVSLWAVNDMAGFIAFRTSLGKSFEAGKKKVGTEVKIRSGDSFIAGVVGRAGDESIDSLGIVFWKPIRRVRLLNLDYPSLGNQIVASDPEIIFERDYCNAAQEPRQFAAFEVDKEVRTTTTSCWHILGSLTAGVETEVQGGVPILAGTRSNFSFEVKVEVGTNHCNEKVHGTLEKLQLPALTLPPRSRTSYRATQYKGVLGNLPFTATLEYTFRDGNTLPLTIKGDYQGIAFSKLYEGFENMTDAENCTDQ